MWSAILPTDADPSVPYRSERVSPGGTKQVVYTIPDPPKMPIDIVEREEAVGDYLPGGYLRVRIGDRFAHRYRIVRKLGWGHFSTVWLAHDGHTDSHVALKFVKSAPRYSQTATDEVTLLQHIIDARDDAHPGRDRLVTFLDSFAHTNPRTTQVHHCIAFEPLGMNLLQLLQQPEYKHRGVPVPLVKQIARQVLHGLDYLHRVCGLVHTDLKPENILLRIAPDHIEHHIRAELASSPPAMERSVPISASSRSHANSYYSHRRQNVYIVGSQPLSSPSPTWSGSASSKSLSCHAQFEQLALRMSKLVVEEEERTSANSSCAASAIFSLTSTSAAESGWTSEAEDCPPEKHEDSDTPRLSIVDGPSLLTKTAPVPISTKLEAKREAEDQVSIKIADLGNAARIGRHVTESIQSLLIPDTISFCSCAMPISSIPERCPSQTEMLQRHMTSKRVSTALQKLFFANDGARQSISFRSVAWYLSSSLATFCLNLKRASHCGQETTTTFAKCTKRSSSLSVCHAQFEQLALRMSKLVVEEEEEERQTSANSSCAASAIFSLTSTSAAESGWTSEAEDCPPAPVMGEDSDTPRLSVADGPSLLTKTAPVPITKLQAKRVATEDQVSIKIADLGNAARIGRHVTDDIQTRQYRSPEVILRKRWGPEVDIFSLGCVFELITGDFLFEPKAREPLWSRDDDHICQMHEALGPFTHSAAFGGQHSRAIFRSDCTLRNVPARKINLWPIISVLKDKYELSEDRAVEIDEFLRPLLALDPTERATALEAGEHPWLWS
ncbi:unnamed protein product [Rhizoctonia solani]|uniref:non-specific serine/threonine protein kinase n=1 Tax=Rhizoctonia solani TaxID=456999 RepID=A0A8H3B3R7_9AGAM|nr:unnamed protein product [Rhizoctonia solani]